MADCGASEFLRGGVLTETRVTDSAITDSRVSSSNLQSCNLQSLASVDDASARTIAAALAALPDGALAELSKAIAKQLATSFLGAGNAPATNMDVDLPVTLVGGRDILLGRPVAWLKYQDYVIPGFTEKE